MAPSPPKKSFHTKKGIGIIKAAKKQGDGKRDGSNKGGKKQGKGKGAKKQGQVQLIRPLSLPTQTWTLDRSGNWKDFTQQTPALTQQRVHNAANEITPKCDTDTTICSTAGADWLGPQHDKAGNMTTMPQPKLLSSSFTATYDAWNRLAELKDGANTVAAYKYDALNRRIVSTPYTAGTADDPRHFYYSNRWQVLEEVVAESGGERIDRQFVWGIRYIDDLVLRDRSVSGGTLNERLYALQDANWNIVAITNNSGVVQQRFAYDPYGSMTKLDPDFTSYTGTVYDWEYTYTSRRLDDETGLMHYRNRCYHPELGRFVSRDPIGYDGSNRNLYQYVGSNPTNSLDPTGLCVFDQAKFDKALNDLGDPSFFVREEAERTLFDMQDCFTGVAIWRIRQIILYGDNLEVRVRLGRFLPKVYEIYDGYRFEDCDCGDVFCVVCCDRAYRNELRIRCPLPPPPAGRRRTIREQIAVILARKECRQKVRKQYDACIERCVVFPPRIF